jgi:hypothetical protein
MLYDDPRGISHGFDLDVSSIFNCLEDMTSVVPIKQRPLRYEFLYDPNDYIVSSSVGALGNHSESRCSNSQQKLKKPYLSPYDIDNMLHLRFKLGIIIN